MKWVKLALIALIALSGPAAGQVGLDTYGSATPPKGNGVAPTIGPGGIAAIGPGTTGGGTGLPPPTPCGAWQLDFSLNTGCNLVLAGH